MDMELNGSNTTDLKEYITGLKNNLQCSICLELLSKPISTKCGHDFCEFCILQYLKRKTNSPCPLCKVTISKRGLKARDHLNTLTEAVRGIVVAYEEDTGSEFRVPNGSSPTNDITASPEVLEETVPRKDSNKSTVVVVKKDFKDDNSLYSDEHDPAEEEPAKTREPDFFVDLVPENRKKQNRKRAIVKVKNWLAHLPKIDGFHEEKSDSQGSDNTVLLDSDVENETMDLSSQNATIAQDSSRSMSMSSNPSSGGNLRDSLKRIHAMVDTTNSKEDSERKNPMEVNERSNSTSFPVNCRYKKLRTYGKRKLVSHSKADMNSSHSSDETSPGKTVTLKEPLEKMTSGPILSKDTLMQCPQFDDVESFELDVMTASQQVRDKVTADKERTARAKAEVKRILHAERKPEVEEAQPSELVGKELDNEVATKADAAMEAEIFLKIPEKNYDVVQEMRSPEITAPLNESSQFCSKQETVDSEIDFMKAVETVNHSPVQSLDFLEAVSILSDTEADCGTSPVKHSEGFHAGVIKSADDDDGVTNENNHGNIDVHDGDMAETVAGADQTAKAPLVGTTEASVPSEGRPLLDDDDLPDLTPYQGNQEQRSASTDLQMPDIVDDKKDALPEKFEDNPTVDIAVDVQEDFPCSVASTLAPLEISQMTTNTLSESVCPTTQMQEKLQKELDDLSFLIKEKEAMLHQLSSMKTQTESATNDSDSDLFCSQTDTVCKMESSLVKTSVESEVDFARPETQRTGDGSLDPSAFTSTMNEESQCGKRKREWKRIRAASESESDTEFVPNSVEETTKRSAVDSRKKRAISANDACASINTASVLKGSELIKKLQPEESPITLKSTLVTGGNIILPSLSKTRHIATVEDVYTKSNDADKDYDDRSRVADTENNEADDRDASGHLPSKNANLEFSEADAKDANNDGCSNIPDTEQEKNSKDAHNELTSSPILTAPSVYPGECLRRRRERCRGIVVSGLDSRSRDYIASFLQKFDFQFSHTFTEETSHVVVQTSNDDSLVCDRTLKYFLGIAGRCWVVSKQWLIDCVQENFLEPEDSYEIKGDTVNGPDHCGPFRARNSKSQLLTDITICCHGEFTNLTRDDIVRLITLCGGQALTNEEEFLTKSRNKWRRLILAEPHENLRSSYFHALRDKYTMPVVSREWLLDSVAKYQVQRLKDYSLCVD